MPPAIYIKLRSFGDLDDLRRKVNRWEDLGVAGVVASDHMFTSRSRPKPGEPSQRHEPFTLLACIGTLTQNLRLSVLVSNVSLNHPAQIARKGAELAYLFGGERICVGLGAGWNTEEFESLGESMPIYRERVARLEESAVLLRHQFDEGIVSLRGRHVRADRLPLNPAPTRSPQLAIGGGSAAVIRIAARYADHLDFDAPSHRLPLRRSENGPALRELDLRRRMVTTLQDLLESKRVLDEAVLERGGSHARLTTSLNVTAVRTGVHSAQAIDGLNELYDLALDHSSLDQEALDSPFFLVGPPDQVLERLLATASLLELAYVVLPDSAESEALLAYAASRR